MSSSESASPESALPDSLAHYTIVAPIGKGGMGEVVRARDTKLGREVALKLLPEEFAQDRERVARFEREARTLAALQHQNIATIYGFEEAEGRIFLVMELVEGEDLSRHIEKGPLRVDEALAVAAQIAAGLEEAHERGIVHRDLKPANVMLMPDGQVKILDFGLARAFLGESTGEESLSNSPTLTAAMTSVGVILGTAAYMSPEQARGQKVDRRADIWALGVILFEMLTGRRLFRGETISDTLAAVLREEPDWDALPNDLPPRATRMLTRCLDRDPRRRLRDAGEMRVAFERPEELSAAAVTTAPVQAAATSARAGLWIAILLVAGLGAAGLAWLLKPASEAPLRKLELGLAPGAMLDAERSGLAISPNGKRIAYVDQERLWIRRLDQVQPLEIPDSEGATLPAWSPDGAWLAFVVDKTIWKIPAEGGQRTRVGDAPSVMGAAAGLAWQTDGRLYLTPGNTGLYAIPATGGKSELVTEVDGTTEQDYHDVAPLPADRGVIYVIHRLTDGVCALGVWDGQQHRQIAHRPGERLKNPVYSSTGHILYSAGNADPSIWGLAYDLDRLEVTGEPFLVAQSADVPRVSDDGNLVYLSGGAVQREYELVLVDRQGKDLRIFGRARDLWPFPALAPNGREAVVIAQTGGEWDLWLYDDRGAQVRLSDTFSEEDCPVISSDGRHVYYADGTAARWFIARRALDGTGKAEIIVSDQHPPHYYGANPWFSRDGKLMLYSSNGGETGNDITALRLGEEGAVPEPVIATKANELAAQLSPDGDYVAYVSDITGRFEVYLARYPTGAGRRQVSVEGGMWPQWRGDGEELFYVSGDSLVAVDIQLGERHLIGAPRRLFAVGPTLHSMGTGYIKGYDASSDGEQFLIVRPVENEGDAVDGTRIVHVENWIREFD